MKPYDSEKLILAAGILVLGISLAWPASQKLAEMHGVREVASQVVEVPRKLVSSGKPGKTLSVQVKTIVDGLSPDAAMADAELRDSDSAKSKATPIPEKDVVTADSASAAARAVEVDWSGPGEKDPSQRQSRPPRKWSFPAQ